ncbi:2TM domain-containing protein [Vibrio eleionomae]|uniref:2TM domain-containing protein n=1 Tax=Vibrio eleionomae TaxID=2653505 RepID=UPI003CFFDE42
MVLIKQRRLQKGWSQEQLSQFSGLSVRTIQRIERGQKPSLESLKSLAAVFEISIAELQLSDTAALHSDSAVISDEQQKVEKKVQAIKGFYSSLVTYVIVIAALFVVNILTNPHYIWAVWPALGWGIGIVIHGLNAFQLVNLFGPQWEKKQIEKRLGRK